MDGVTVPLARCDLDPRTFSDAESLGTHGRGACTVRDAYRITAMEGVQFSEPAIVNCATAGRFKDWLQSVVQPAAVQSHRERVTHVTIAASYACRGRNGRRGARLSEHGFGNAIDVSALRLADGTEFNVERDYYRSALLKKIRKGACGLFSTVLGPGSDRSHRDHMHFDLSQRRSGQAFCR